MATNARTITTAYAAAVEAAWDAAEGTRDEDTALDAAAEAWDAEVDDIIDVRLSALRSETLGSIRDAFGAAQAAYEAAWDAAWRDSVTDSQERDL